MTLPRRSLSITLGIIVFVVALGGYTTFQFRTLIAGPQLTLETPRDGATQTASLVEVRGSARNISTLTLNGRKIFINEADRFSERLVLAYGYNIITVTATDSLGRSETRVRRVVYK